MSMSLLTPSAAALPRPTAIAPPSTPTAPLPSDGNASFQRMLAQARQHAPDAPRNPAAQPPVAAPASTPPKTPTQTTDNADAADAGTPAEANNTDRSLERKAAGRAGGRPAPARGAPGRAASATPADDAKPGVAKATEEDGAAPPALADAAAAPPPWLTPPPPANAASGVSTTTAAGGAAPAVAGAGGRAAGPDARASAALSRVAAGDVDPKATAGAEPSTAEAEASPDAGATGAATAKAHTDRAASHAHPGGSDRSTLDHRLPVGTDGPAPLSATAGPAAAASAEPARAADALLAATSGSAAVAAASAAAAPGAAAAPLAAEMPAPLQASLGTPVTSPEFRRALGVQISVLAEGGVQHAELTLNPAEMGPISVRISMEGDSARVDFGADVARTRDAIEAGWAELAASLQDAGFTLSGGGVSQHSQQSRDGGNGAGSGSRNGGGRSSDPGRIDELSAPPTVRRATTSAGGVDLFA